MLTKKELSEYWTQEKLERKEFTNNLLKPKTRKGLKYPKEERFKKIINPTAVISSRNIWAQIPLYETVFINLPPWPQRKMIEELHWGTDTDIKNLISLSRNTGKVQFLLNSSPLDYEKFHHLHPILEELRPPCLLGGNAVDLSNPTDKMYYDEFMEEANKFFVYEMERLYSSVSERYVQKRINDYATDYIIMKKIGYYEISNEMLKYLNTDFDIANAYFTIFGNLVVVPATDPVLSSYSAVFSENLGDYEEFIQTLKLHQKKNVSNQLTENIIPGEIGHFIMQKLVPLSESYEAANSLMTRYESEELYKLMNSIKTGYQKRDIDIIQNSNKELAEVFDNVWKDANRIKKLTAGIDVGFSISLMAIGYLLTLPVGGIGALAGLGFKVADKYLPSPSSKIVDFFSPNYLVAINDFKKRHNIQ